jgi:hypothetical protein
MEHLKAEALKELTDDELREELAELESESVEGVQCGMDAGLVAQECRRRGLDVEFSEPLSKSAFDSSTIGSRLSALPQTILLSEGYVGLQWDEMGKFAAASRHMKCRQAAADALSDVGITATVADPVNNAAPLYDLALVLNGDWVTSDEDTGESVIPPQSVAEAAARGLRLRERFRRGGTAVGVARARDLSNRRPLSPQTTARMRSFFARHGAQVDRRSEGWDNERNPSAQWIAWLLWGGDAGRDWAERQRPVEKVTASKLSKSADEWRVIYYIVSEPDTVDAHGHQIDADTIRRALHAYMNGKREVRFEHDKEITGRAVIVEGFVAPCELTEFHGEKLESPVAAGSSIVGIHYPDDALWQKLRDDEHGISFGGYARQVETPETE